MIPDSEEKLQRLVNRLQEECERVGRRINTEKIEVMGVTKRNERPPIEISIGGRKQSDKKTNNIRSGWDQDAALVGVENIGEVVRRAQHRGGWINNVANVNFDTAHR